jgi:predicted Fe-S protein YdhL (DUF1289 family)
LRQLRNCVPGRGIYVPAYAQPARAETRMIESPTIESPCVDICTLDVRTGLCLGCGRTIDEIAAWGSMSAAERRRVIGELPARIVAARPAARLRG